ncbi:MAG: rod-binding protein [Treponema sp.]|jgi:flagellar protein FlgJ|nr:rod-binding protein [Treponema sp.]
MGIESIGSLYIENIPQVQMDALLRRAETTEAVTGESFAAVLDKTLANASEGSVASSGSSAARIDKTSELFQQCEALETFLLKSLLAGMRSTVQKSGFIDTGFAGEMYEDMLWDQYAEDFSKNTDFGLAEMASLELTGQRAIR